VTIPARTDVDDNTSQLNLPGCLKNELVSLAEDDRPTMATTLAAAFILKDTARAFDRLSRRLPGGIALPGSCSGIPAGEFETWGTYEDHPV
jgi:hypothetical protein